MRIVLALLRLSIGLLVVVTAVPAILALFGFAVPELDLLNHLQLLLFVGTIVGAALALACRTARAWQVLAIIGVLASGWTYVPEWLSSFAPRPAASGGQTVKVMTHNIFGLNYDMPRVAAVIEAEDPDIVALQEYFPEQAGLGELLKARYPYSVRCQGGKRANLGLYSKIPFEREMTESDCPDTAYGAQRTAHITAAFALEDGSRFTLMTTHMDWPFPIARQRDEFDATEEAIAELSGPLLVVGDFNSTPWSYAMKGFEATTGLRRETRNLLTYPLLFTVPVRFAPDGLANTLPFLALDQVFSRGVDVHTLGVGPATGSDHLPVVFTFSLTKAQ